jgi:hypothetical protein
MTFIGLIFKEALFPNGIGLDPDSLAVNALAGAAIGIAGAVLLYVQHDGDNEAVERILDREKSVGK